MQAKQSNDRTQGLSVCDFSLMQTCSCLSPTIQDVFRNFKVYSELDQMQSKFPLSCQFFKSSHTVFIEHLTHAKSIISSYLK